MRKFGYFVLASLIACVVPLDASAKKPEQVDISAGMVEVFVSNGRIVRGNPRVQVKVVRRQADPCTKVRYVRMVKGLNPLSVSDELAIKKVTNRKRGLCNFTVTLPVQPWTDAELVRACRTNRRSAPSPWISLKEHATVTLWKTRPEYKGKKFVQTGTKRSCHQERYCISYGLGGKCVEWGWREKCEQVPDGYYTDCEKICAGDKIRLIKDRHGNVKQNPDHHVWINAKVHCQRQPVSHAASTAISTTSPPDMSGWWKMQSSYAGSAVNGLWKFSTSGRTSPAQRRFSTMGIAGPTGVMARNGRGSATLTGTNEFMWQFSWNNRGATASMECKGVLNSGTRSERVTGKCYPIRGVSRGANPLGTFSLIRSNIIQTPKPSPVGKPQAPGGLVIPQQKKPQLPGGGFKPGPNLPPATPRW